MVLCGDHDRRDENLTELRQILAIKKHQACCLSRDGLVYLFVDRENIGHSLSSFLPLKHLIILISLHHATGARDILIQYAGRSKLWRQVARHQRKPCNEAFWRAVTA